VPPSFTARPGDGCLSGIRTEQIQDLGRPKPAARPLCGTTPRRLEMPKGRQRRYKGTKKLTQRQPAVGYFLLPRPCDAYFYHPFLAHLPGVKGPCVFHTLQGFKIHQAQMVDVVHVFKNVCDKTVKLQKGTREYTGMANVLIVILILTNSPTLSIPRQQTKRAKGTR
jgi:hypothetical protein